jgi:predicted nucleic acid-binding protein
MRVALDTNILAYAEGVNDKKTQHQSLDLVKRLSTTTVVLPVQVLGELFSLLVRKAGRTPAEARSAVLHWRNAFNNLTDTSVEVFLAAVDLAQSKVSFWDAAILSAAAESGCQILLSEDLQDGFVWKGVTVINPFKKPQPPMLEAILDPVS